jgi:hypothetical protein
MLDFFQTGTIANSAKGTPGFAPQFVSPLETQSFLETLTSRTRTGFRSHTEQLNKKITEHIGENHGRKD